MIFFFFFLALYSKSNILLLVARHILPTGLAFKNAPKVGTINFANSLSPPSIVKKYAPEVKTAMGLKRCRVKVKGVNNPV